MENFFDLTTAFCEEDDAAQLFVQIDEASENRFLEAVGGAATREKDLVAFVDQYAATGITALCFPLSNKQLLPVWVQRCRKVGLQAFLLLSPCQLDDADGVAQADMDGIVLDCRQESALPALSLCREKTGDRQLFVLMTQGTEVAAAHDADGIIVFPAQKSCRKLCKPTSVCYGEDFRCYAGVYNYLCFENEKHWYPTAEIMNAIAVQCLSTGFYGLYLDGFCADPFDADSDLYDMYDTCAVLSEAAGARRRHLAEQDFPVRILSGADWKTQITRGPVLEGAAVCLILGINAKDAVDVTVNGKPVSRTGIPVVLARNENGKVRENGCIAASFSCEEYFVENDSAEPVAEVCVHNHTDRPVSIGWLEMTVNI